MPADVARGSGAVPVVEGEAGIGKTRLAGGTVALLWVAAVIGRDAGLVLLRAASGLDAGQVVTWLEAAVTARLLRADRTAGRWRFRHGLVRETLPAGLGRMEAARLHATVAAALRGSDAEVDRLAHHHLRAAPVTGAGPGGSPRRSG